MMIHIFGRLTATEQAEIEDAVKCRHEQMEVCRGVANRATALIAILALVWVTVQVTGYTLEPADILSWLIAILVIYAYYGIRQALGIPVVQYVTRLRIYLRRTRRVGSATQASISRGLHTAWGALTQRFS